MRNRAKAGCAGQERKAEAALEAGKEGQRHLALLRLRTKFFVRRPFLASRQGGQAASNECTCWKNKLFYFSATWLRENSMIKYNLKIRSLYLHHRHNLFYLNNLVPKA